jgi:glycosyltransferase involved in cell wall biosynthesis
MTKQNAIILPAFNKANDIEEVVRRITRLLLDSQIICDLIIVDDGSSDDTQEKLESIVDEFGVIVITHETNQGKGQAIRTGMQFALEKYKVIGYFDADLDLSVTSLLDALSYMLKYNTEILIGSKRHPQSVVQYPISRRFLSFIFQTLSQVLVGLNISDSQTGLKLFRHDVLSKILPHTKLVGFAFDLELLAIARIYGFRSIEFPVEIKFAFSSTVGLHSAWRAVLDLFVIKYSIRNIKKENN